MKVLIDGYMIIYGDFIVKQRQSFCCKVRIVDIMRCLSLWETISEREKWSHATTVFNSTNLGLGKRAHSIKHDLIYYRALMIAPIVNKNQFERADIASNAR